MRENLSEHGKDLIFRKARTHNSWRPLQVAEALLREVYDLAKIGATSANCCPARFVFVVSAGAKEKLRPALNPSNVAKTIAAPVTAVIGYDLFFYEKLPQLFPHNPAVRSWYEGKPQLVRETAFRNSSLQGAYLMIAARSLGLDCGPMSGFDQEKVNALFWPDGRTVANFLCNIGYGDGDGIFPRSPRLEFDQTCSIV